MSWRETTLGEITNLKRGFDLPKSQRLQGDVPVYSSSGITGSNSTAAVEGPCVITGRCGTIGEVFFSSGPCWPLNTALYSTEFNGNNPRFVYYLLQTIPWKGYTTASAVPGVNRNHVNLCPVKIPDRATQDAIVEVLDSIVDKIALNNQLNDYLLEVGEMRFADLETRGTLSKTVHIADLPHILETGKRPKGGAASCGIPSVGAENVKKLGEFNYSSNKYIPRTFADNLKKGRVNGYELIIYKDGGRPGQFIPHFSMFGEGYPYKEFYINEHVFKLDFGDRGLNEFAYYYFHTPYVMKWLETNGTKAAIPGINRQNIEELEFPDPEQESVQDFCKRIQPYFTAIFRNCLENKQLQSLRDTLLPRLMSGEIDVSKVDLTQLTNNHLWVHGHNVPNRYWKGRLWKPSLIMFCHRCRTCSIRHSSNIWPKYSESRYCQLRKHPCRRIC